MFLFPYYIISHGLHPNFALAESFLYDGPINDHNCNFHDVNDKVPQYSVLAPTLILLHINDFLSSTFNLIHSYADDCWLHPSV